jgi:lysozyme
VENQQYAEFRIKGDESWKMINGIDISHHNQFNWDLIRSLTLLKNLYFAFAKASEGTNNPDNEYAVHRRGSASAGLLHSPYHFFLPTEDPALQIQLFKRQVGSLKAGDLPPVIDIEWTKIERGGRIRRPELWDQVPRAQRIDVTLSVLNEVVRQLGVNPMIYTHPVFWRDYITANNPPAAYAQFAEYPLWLVDLQGRAQVPHPWTRADFIQNHFGETAPPGAFLFDRLDHDFYNANLRKLLSLAIRGLAFDKDNTPVSSIVRDFQKSLRDKSFYHDNLDGDFGVNTEQATKAFQQSVGLPVTGVIDEATWQQLL